MSSAPLPYAITFLVRDCCLCLHVQRAARALARRFDDAFRALQLTHGQFSMLMALNRPVAATMRDVAELLAMDRTTLTAALKPLARRGLISMVTADVDRRARLLSLTKKGKKLLSEAVPIWQRTHSELERRLPSGQPQRLREELAALR